MGSWSNPTGSWSNRLPCLWSRPPAACRRCRRCRTSQTRRRWRRSRSPITVALPLGSSAAESTSTFVIGPGPGLAAGPEHGRADVEVGPEDHRSVGVAGLRWVALLLAARGLIPGWIAAGDIGGVHDLGRVQPDDRAPVARAERRHCRVGALCQRRARNRVGRERSARRRDPDGRGRALIGREILIRAGL